MLGLLFVLEYDEHGMLLVTITENAIHVYTVYMVVAIVTAIH